MNLCWVFFKILFNCYNLVYLAMSWLILLACLAKVLFLDTHAKTLQVRTNFDIFMGRAMSRSWQDLPRFACFLSRCIKFRFTVSLGPSHYSAPPPSLWYVYLVGEGAIRYTTNKLERGEVLQCGEDPICRINLNHWFFFRLYPLSLVGAYYFT